MYSYFQNKTKAEVLIDLKKKKLKFKIPKTYYFSIADWKKNYNSILDKILLNFKSSNKVAIRSSSTEEDKSFSSNAGKFSSELKIPKNKKKILIAIKSVIRSYRKQIEGKNLNKNQILVQEMIDNTSMSGVIFTKDLDSGANYYSINYDDVTGLTDTVTSGSGEHSNKTLLIYKNAFSKIRSLRFKKLISAVIDLESKINEKNIDIEFGMTKTLTPYLFQARPIVINPNWKPVSEIKFNKNLTSIENKLKSKFKRDKNIFGKTTVFGQMPDWNPAEIIGKNPSRLAYTLYSELITKSTWAQARKLMGYKDLTNFNLMTNICEQPYIDTRLSFNSFLPSKLDKAVSEKIVNFSIQKLTKNPILHDKIEFDIAITSFSFDFEKKVKKLYGTILNKKEISLFKKHIKDLTIKNVNTFKNGSLNNALKEINKLSKIQLRKKKYSIDDLSQIIYDCKKFGTLQFSILARHGFIGRDLLLSLKENKILNFKDIEKFQLSIETVTSEMLHDLKKLDRKNFMFKYGHLRPGTYDILSKRYDQIKGLNILTDLSNKKKINFKINNKKLLKIEKLIKKNGFKVNSAQDLLNYIRKSTIAREYAKFVFTKSISQILEIIANHGQKLGLDREKLSHIPISLFLSKKNFLKKKKLISISNLNKKNYLLAKTIRLPQVIYDLAGVKIVPFQVNSPNFISRQTVQTEKVFLDSRNYSFKLKNKIIMIGNADPGFDWIFTQKISGLITKYGGVNSHMAIRCAELGIPAAIGCGEQRFESLKKLKIICLDCASSNIYGA